MNGLLTIDQAARQIAAILARLESVTGETVESISLGQIEVTQLESRHPEMAMHVNIEMFRMPGHRWQS